MKFDIDFNVSYIKEKIENLAKFTDPNIPFTRIVFSEQFYDARNWLKKEFNSLNLEVSTDNAGNLIGSLKSNIKTEKVVILGSHIDTVPSGGRYDGIAGIVSSLCVMKHIIENDISLPFNLSIYDYLGEELNDWSISCVGSRGIAGLLTEEILNRQNSVGQVLKDEINKIGGNTKFLDKPLSIAKNIIACLELHIEQGKILEQKKINIGVVRSIPSISRFNVKVIGQAGHSGTILMDQRADALVASSEIITFVNKLALRLSQESNQHFVSTIGKITVSPNAAAIIPGKVEMTIDLRSSSKSSREQYIKELEEKIELMNKTGTCKIDMNNIAYAPFVEMDKELVKLFKDSANSCGLTNQIMDSGAGHDTAQLSRLVPAAMIFIPCKEGLSHCPEEHAEILDISKGTAVLLKMVENLAMLNRA
ncbi:MAG: Zn-dependent hydrolase [Candidatus Puniceispirillales bacterium]|nr:Zn-dependent hydrolase [Alphaproteobacteria bacterium]